MKTLKYKIWKRSDGGCPPLPAPFLSPGMGDLRVTVPIRHLCPPASSPPGSAKAPWTQGLGKGVVERSLTLQPHPQAVSCPKMQPGRCRQSLAGSQLQQLVPQAPWKLSRVVSGPRGHRLCGGEGKLILWDPKGGIVCRALSSARRLQFGATGILGAAGGIPGLGLLADLMEVVPAQDPKGQGGLAHSYAASRRRHRTVGT